MTYSENDSVFSLAFAHIQLHISTGNQGIQWLAFVVARNSHGHGVGNGAAGTASKSIEAMCFSASSPQLCP